MDTGLTCAQASITQDVDKSKWKRPSPLFLPDYNAADARVSDEDLCMAFSTSSPLPRDQWRSVTVTLLYNHEADLLLAGLLEYLDVVKEVIIIDSDKTFMGKPKESWYHTYHHKEFAWAGSKVRSILAELPEPHKSFKRENAHRRAGLEEWLATDPKDDDVVLMLDVDEIPRRQTIRAIQRCPLPYPENGLLRFLSWSSFFVTTCHGKHQGNAWGFTRRYLEHTGLDESSDTRVHTPKGPMNELQDAAWQHGWMISLDDTITKMSSFSHYEYDLAKNKDPDGIRKRAWAGQSLYDDSYPCDASNTLANLKHCPSDGIMANIVYFCSRGFLRGDDCPPCAKRGAIGDRDELP